VITVAAQQKGGVGKTTTAVNVGVLLAGQGQRVLVIDTDPQVALTRQLGLQERMLGVNLVDVLAERALAQDAIVADVHGVDVIPAARELAGVETSLVGELGRERFLRDALAPVLESYDQVVIDTPPNLGLLTVNALVCADRVLAPVTAEDEASVHGILELRATITRLAQRLHRPPPALLAMLTRWQPVRVSSRRIEQLLIGSDLAPVAKIRSRSAAVATAAAGRVPLVVNAPDSSVAIGYLSASPRKYGHTEGGHWR
jgi:chromosome partitioning protein